MMNIRQSLRTREPADRGRIGRRTFLVVTGSGILAACTTSDDPDADSPTDAPSVPVEGKEAPMLAEQVEAGTLPPLAERLPAEPVVVEPVDQIGAYGGAWQTAMLGPAGVAWQRRTMTYENLVRLVPDFSGAAGVDEIIPNIAQSFEIEDGGRSYLFTLREGMKWSDGHPFTTEDIAFAYEDVLLNEELYPSPPPEFVSGGAPASLEVIDDYSFRLVLAAPNGLFLPRLARVDGWLLTAHPKHYLEQFHADYNPDVGTLASQEGQPDWVSLFFSKTGGPPVDFVQDPEMPQLFPWIISVPPADGRQAVAVRNPYYFKVDPEGRQLPYLDEVRYDVVDDPEVMLLSALQGEIDMHVQNINTSTNKPVLAEEQESGGYHFFDTFEDLMNNLVVMFNLTHSDPVKRELFTNKDFRIGLSHAINRQEIIDTAYQRQGEPWQVAPRPETPFAHEEMAKQYTEFDVDLANEFLDQGGFAERDGSGMRLGPGGQPIRFTIEFATGVFPEWSDALELIKGYWEEVGIQVDLNPIERSLFEERRRANEHDVTLWAGGGGVDVILNPFWYAPLSDRSDYAQLWAAWYTSGGASGEEPPENVRRQMELYDELKSQPDGAEQERLMGEILQIAKDEFYSIGIVLPADGYGIVKDNFHNVPQRMHVAWQYPAPGPTNPEQYFKS